MLKVMAEKPGSVTKQSWTCQSQSSLPPSASVQRADSPALGGPAPRAPGSRGRDGIPQSNQGKKPRLLPNPSQPTAALCRQNPEMLVTIAAIYGDPLRAGHCPKCSGPSSGFSLPTTWKDTEMLSRLPRTHS